MGLFTYAGPIADTNYFQVYSMQLNKNCTAFDPSGNGVCIACAVGYYRPDTNPGTGCILPVDALINYGPEPISNLYVPLPSGNGLPCLQKSLQDVHSL